MDRSVYKIIHLIYRSKNYEGQSKDYEFSRRSMLEHWQAGYIDAVRTLRHPEALHPPQNARQSKRSISPSMAGNSGARHKGSKEHSMKEAEVKARAFAMPLTSRPTRRFPIASSIGSS